MGRNLTNLSFFSGVGGLDLGAKLAGGIETIAYCEYDRYAQGVLRSRIADGGLDDGPIWDDVTSFDGKPWRGTDIVSGGFPCQDVSVAGKRAGVEEGTRSGLFYELMRVCREVEPRFILLENVAGLLIYPGAHRVFGELASMGYDAGWKIISASSVGANHQRKRIWIVAHSQESKGRLPIREKEKESRPGECSKNVADPKRSGQLREKQLENSTEGGREWWGFNSFEEREIRELEGNRGNWWSVEPNVGRMAYGVDFRVDRLKCCGNGVVPQQSIPAWEEIKRLSGEF